DPKQRLRDIGDARDLLETLETPVPARVSRWPKVIWAIFGISLIALVGLGATYFWKQESEPAAVIFPVLPPADTIFSGQAPAISPDGTRIAFLATTGSAVRVWIRSLDNKNARPLPGTEGARAAFWSYDGKSIAFEAGGKLKRTPS